MHEIGDTLTRINVDHSTTFLNLTMFHMVDRKAATARYLTLEQAVKRKLARVTEVSEHGHVPELRLENRAKKPVLILDGEELIGAKQNRIANVTILAPAGKTIMIPVSCVEAGRWGYSQPARGESAREFKPSQRIMFHRARVEKASAVNESMRASGTRYSDQGNVWREISDKAQRMQTHSPTSAMGDIFEHHGGRVSDYVNAFKAVDKQVGALFAIDGKIEGFDLFDSEKTFARLMPKLVQSFAIDALETTGRRPVSAPANAEARRFLDKVAKAEVEAHPAVGLGTEVRLTGRGLVAGGLVADEKLVHLAAFATRPVSRSGESEADGIERARTRRRRFVRR